MEEKILMQGLCNRIRGAFVGNGHGMLTNKRFIYSKHGFAKTMIMGAFVNLTKGSFDFDIPLEDIVEIKEARRALSKIMVISTNSNEYRFYFTKLEEWKIAFNNALSNLGKTEPEKSSGSVADELLKLKSLLDSGAISQEEFNKLKADLI